MRHIHGASPKTGGSMDGVAQHTVNCCVGNGSVIARWQGGAMRQRQERSDPTPRHPLPLAAARELAQAIAGTLRVARSFVAAGRRIDLVGLEEPVGLLCARSLDLPPEQGRQMRTGPINLRQELDVLFETLQTPPA